jgi:hypothetical protein
MSPALCDDGKQEHVRELEVEVERPADVEEYLAVANEMLKGEASDIVGSCRGYNSVFQPMCDWVIHEGGETDSSGTQSRYSRVRCVDANYLRVAHKNMLESPDTILTSLHVKDNDKDRPKVWMAFSCPLLFMTFSVLTCTRIVLDI